MSEHQQKTLTDDQVAAYLARIAVSGDAEPTAATLRELQLQHLRTVPFENLSIHLDEPISLALTDLFAKVVEDRRGGFCYELNGLFAALLRAVGYHVQLFSCAVHGPHDLGPPFEHLALSVGTSDDSRRWLVDVGFGRHSAYPLQLDTPGDQDDPLGVFRLRALANGDVDVCRDDRPQYRIEPRARALSDFEPTCWWQQTRPGSHFRAGPVCSLLTPSGGLLTLAGHLLIRTEGGERTETTLASDAEVLAAYEQHFGVLLATVPLPVEGADK